MQHVQEVGVGQGADFRFPAPAVLVTKADLAVAVLIAGQEVGLPDYPAIEIAAEIDERLVAVADAYAINHTVLR